MNSNSTEPPTMLEQLLQHRHPSVAQVARWFDYSHLPAHLADTSSAFYGLACNLLRTIPDGPELTVALRKLLESKDAAVRAAIEAQPPRDAA